MTELQERATSVVSHLRQTGEALKTAITNLHEQTERRADAKWVLAQKQIDLTLGGLEGKNDRERQAYLDHLTADERAELDAAEGRYAAARAAFDRAEVDVKTARAQADLLAAILKAT